MMHAMNCSRRSFLCATAALIAFASCTGDGSDIGPSFATLPSGTCKALVLDAQGRGVSGARVSIGSTVAVTGRSGRAELYGDRRGTQLVHIDASNASATNADRLSSMTVAVSVAGPDLPDALFLPDTSASVALTVSTGAALPATDLDDSANTGAILRLPAGTVVADGANATVDLRLGELGRGQLPSALPSAPSGAWLSTRGFFVEPETATFALGATLVVPDELALAGTACSLFRLDPLTGQWQQVAGAASSTGGVIQLANGVTTGGLYAYAFDAPIATLRGRVLDINDAPVTGAQVRVDSVPTATDNEGRFVATIAAADGAGAPRTVDIELRGGGFWLPIARGLTHGPIATGANVDLGDLELDTTPCSTLRVQLIRRGRGQSGRRVTSSGGSQPTLSAAFTDDLGQCTIEEVPAGWSGTSLAFLLTGSGMTVNEMLTFLSAGIRQLDLRTFYADRDIGSEGGNARVLALDPIGGGQIEGADMVRGRVPNEGYTGVTGQGGAVFINRSDIDRITATVVSEANGRQTTSAFSFENPVGNRIEMPLVREQKRAIGAFDRHGVVRGQLTGADPLKSQRVLASRPLEFDEWFDSRMQGTAAYENMPVRLGGALPQGAYRAGVALPRGNVVAAEGTVASGRFTLTSVGALLDLVVAEGSSLDRDLPLNRTASTSFVAAGALTGFDAAFAASDLRFDLAVQQPSGLVADVARDIAGNVAANGSGLTFTLPALTGPFEGCAWLIALSASTSDATTSLSQRLMLRFTASTAESYPMLAAPTIASPLDGGTVAAAGFTAQFTAPADADYVEIELRSDGVHTRVWTAVVPASTTEFAFVDLPTEAATPLEAGLTYTMTVRAWRADTGPFVTLANPYPYSDMPTHWFSIAAGERGIRAGSARSITITTN